MLGYKPTTSTVHKVISSGKFGKERSFFQKIISIHSLDCLKSLKSFSRWLFDSVILTFYFILSFHLSSF